MKKIKIKKNTLGDTRTATKVPTFSEFDESNSSHVKRWRGEQNENT